MILSRGNLEKSRKKSYSELATSLQECYLYTKLERHLWTGNFGNSCRYTGNWRMK